MTSAMYDFTRPEKYNIPDRPSASYMHSIPEPSEEALEVPVSVNPLAQLPVQPSALGCSGSACSALNALLASLPPQPASSPPPLSPASPPVTSLTSPPGGTARPSRLSSLMQRLGGAGTDLRRQGLAGLTVGVPLGLALMTALGASPALVAPLAAVIPGYVLAAFARARPPGSSPPVNTGEGTLRMVLRRFLAGQQRQRRRLAEEEG